MWMTFTNIHKQGQDFFHFFAASMTGFHVSSHFPFGGFAAPLGLFQDFVLVGRDGLSLQHGNDVGRSSIGNGQVQGRVIVIVLLVGSLGIGLVQGFHDFQWSIVMSGVVQGEVSVVVLLGSTFGVDLEKELFHLERSLLPSSKMQREISIVVGQGSGVGVCIEEGL